MKPHVIIRILCVLLLVSSVMLKSQAQFPGGPPPDGFGPGGPGGPGGFGPPGGPGGMGQTTRILQQFDKDGDGILNREERTAAREYLKTQRASRPGRMRFPGMGGDGEKPQPGEKITPSDVKNYPEAPAYDPEIIRTFFLYFDDKDWEAEMADFDRTDVEVPAQLIVDGKTFTDVGVHFRGMSSFFMVPEGHKRSLNLSLNWRNKGQEIGNYSTFNLLNSHEDPSFLRPLLYYEVARSYLPAPKANFVRVVINDENWGIYVNVQQINKQFAKDWFGTKRGARWKVPGSPAAQGSLAYLGANVESYRSIYTIKSKDDPEDWAALIHMMKVLNETPPDQLEAQLSPLLDIDGALRFLALDIALINNDGYWIRTSDYEIYRDTAGRFHVIPWDANETFSLPEGGGFGGGGPRGFGGPRGGPAPANILAGELLSQGDKNNDGKLSHGELTALADAWFDKMDVSKTGILNRNQFVQNFGKILNPPPGFEDPDGGPGGPRGGFGPAQFIGPGFFAATDTNHDGTLSREEFRGAFANWADTWDTSKSGSLDETQIRVGFDKALPQQGFGGRRGDRGFRAGGRGMRVARAPIDGIKLSPLYSANDEGRPLASKLLAVPALRDKYLHYVRDIAGNWLDWNKLGPIAQKYHALIADDVKRDTRKLDSTEDFEKSLTEDVPGGGGPGPQVTIGLKNFADQRRAYLLGLPEIQNLKP